MKTARVDDPSDLITHEYIIVSGLSARRKSTSVDQVTGVIHEGGFLFIPQLPKSSPIR
jgi:hypothetical protein